MVKKIITTAYLIFKSALSIETRQDRFRRYALMNKWKDKETVSGPGSTKQYTEILRFELPRVFEKHSVNSMLDAPCGDYNWMRLVDRGNVDYVGGDIVPELVSANNKCYANDNTRFYLCDIVKDSLPDVDLWMCRDVLFHFSYKNIFETLDNLFQSNITYFLTTDHPEHEENYDIRTGSFRTLNIMISPFCFPEPLLWIDDWIEGQPVRRMGLWHVESLRKSIKIQ